MTDDEVNITKIRMEAEAAANQDISVRDAEHTIRAASPSHLQDAESLVDRSMRGELPTGDDLRAELLRRGEEKRALEANLGEGSGFLDYKRSEVGGMAGDREIRRQMTYASRQERKRREQRFGNASQSRNGADRNKRPSARAKRQAFNAGNADAATEQGVIGANRQGFNADNSEVVRSFGGSTIGFREPVARNYNPYG